MIYIPSMKAIAVSAICPLCVCFASAQTNTFPSSGNVGIGTMSPSAPLNVVSNNANAVAISGSSSNSIGLVLDDSAAPNGRSFSIFSSGGGPSPAGSFGIYDNSGGGTRFLIDYSGNVGIGTTNPGFSYQGVSGVATTPVLDLKGTSAANSTLLRLISAPWSGGSYFAGLEFDASDTTTANQSFNVGRIYGIFDANTWSQGRLTFSTPSGTGTWIDTMSLKAGNVGIGTTNPTYPLSVNGTIEAKEVIVQTGWSDYVFDNNYHLAPLKQLDQQIHAEHHLPGIPTAEQVAKHGADLGAVESKLLAKVEELTLYVIDQDKRLDDQARRIDQLERENATLRGSASGGGSPRASTPN